jgi:hypothetical protein
MYYSYVEIEYVATSFSPPRMDLAVKLLTVATLAQIKGGPPSFLVTLTHLERLGWATTNHNHEFKKNS